MTSYRRKNDEKRLKLTKYAFFTFWIHFYQVSRPRKHFRITDSERGIFGLKITQKNHGVDQLEKSLRSFKNFLKEKNSDFFSNVLNFWQFEALTKDRISPKILFISPKSYFRSLKGFQLILGIKIFIGPIDKKFLKIIIFHTSSKTRDYDVFIKKL